MTTAAQTTPLQEASTSLTSAVASAPLTTGAALSFLYLDEGQMIQAGVTDMRQCMETMTEVFTCLAVGDYRMSGESNDSHGAMMIFPEKPEHPGMPADDDDRRFMAMPAYIGGPFQTTGVKWYGSNTENRRKGLPRSIHVFVLNDKDTGAPLAIMSANLISAYRTGAIPGLGALHLAPEDAEVVGIVGPGVMAKTSLEAFMVARPSIKAVKIKGRGRASLEAFRRFAAERFPGLDVQVVESIEQAVRGSDIVTMCTTGGTGAETYPYIDREWVRPGALLSMPSYLNLDDDFIADPAVRKVVDNRGLYEAWAQETPYPHHDAIGIIGNKFMDLVETKHLPSEDIVDLGDIVVGRRTGRRDPEEIVIYSVGGMPVEDVAWATTVYRNAVERGIGTTLNLWDSPAMA